MGALPTLYAALADDVKNGDFFGPSGFMEIKGYPKKTNPNKLATDKTIATKLWSWYLEQRFNRLTRGCRILGG